MLVSEGQSVNPEKCSPWSANPRSSPRDIVTPRFFGTSLLLVIPSGTLRFGQGLSVKSRFLFYGVIPKRAVLSESRDLSSCEDFV